MPYRKAAEVEEVDLQEVLRNEIVATKRTMLEAANALCKRVIEHGATAHAKESADLLDAARATFECVMKHDNSDSEEDDEDD